MGPPGTTGGAWVQPPQAERRSHRGAGRGCRASREPGRGHSAPWTRCLLCERGRRCSHLRALGTSGSTEHPSASPPAQAGRVLRVLCTPRRGGGGPGHQSRKCGKWFSAGKVRCGDHCPRHVAGRVPSSESPRGGEGSCSLSEARIQDRPDRTACAHARKGPGCPHGRDTS